ncbi:RluA family pseudouridine synthase [Agaribacterium sp. ZY112]|uniref:RluA family pseudouridine synthase n=1 Tax=Agaribacterium sp. ZY112 TaxID=3233574 RepID=UPI003523F26E
MFSKTDIVDDFIAPLCAEEITVVYQDEHLLLINKPSGLLSLSGKNPLNKDSVHWRLVQSFPKATLLHRLDFSTSGLMLVALNKEVNGLLTKQFQERRISKRYIAILEGWTEKNHGFIEAPIAKDPTLFPRLKICDISGKVAKTEYRVLMREDEPRRTRVEFIPHTGRTHQLRIHSLALGYPILGCDLYSSATSHQGADRLLLHASQLEFVHPVTHKLLSIQCECPF